MEIIEATSQDIASIRTLFQEYQVWLGIDLCFQGFEEELASLPGKYSPPNGAIFMAIENGELIGCVAIRPISSEEAELKRLFVKPDFHGRGIGKRLFLKAMSKAESIGYTSIVLDTLPIMERAKALYLAYGFQEIPAYYDSPEQGTSYYRYGIQLTNTQRGGVKK